MGKGKLEQEELYQFIVNHKALVETEFWEETSEFKTLTIA